MKIFILTFFVTHFCFSQGDYHIYVDEPPILPGCEMIVNTKDRTDCSKIQFTSLIESSKLKCDGSFEVDFIISKNGTISQVNTKEIINIDCDSQQIQKILEELSKSGLRWIPGKLNQVEVDVMITIDVNFRKKKK